MHRFLLGLACLACAGHSHQAQATTKQSRRDAAAERTQLSKDVAEGRSGPAEALAKVFLALTGAVAYNPTTNQGMSAPMTKPRATGARMVSRKEGFGSAQNGRRVGGTSMNNIKMPRAPQPEQSTTIPDTFKIDSSMATTMVPNSMPSFSDEEMQSAIEKVNCTVDSKAVQEFREWLMKEGAYTSEANTLDHVEVNSQELEEAYQLCKKITERASKTFYAGTKLMTEDQKKAVWAIYTWCRRTDDLVDCPPDPSSEKMLAGLNEWRSRLPKVFDGVAYDKLDLAILDTKKRYPTLSIEPFNDMIKGMMMDTEQFGKNRYETWDELYVYCYRVASTVGLMTLPVLGTAPGYTEEEAKAPAIALGIALQITNILRDVGEDAQRGRIYLPKEDMDRFGVTEQQIMNGVVDENYVNLMKFEIQRARDWYAKSHEGIPMLAKHSRLGVQGAGDMYSKILNKLEENNYDNFRKRAYVNKFEKLVTILGSWMTVSQME
mmetsp:Transcript_99099/g.181781  ORF Transcript_99099/g.181781 Transcript_99099/m.181781 type:complete len:491 (+) Transcript_99099:74-1546(+)